MVVQNPINIAELLIKITGGQSIQPLLHFSNLSHQFPSLTKKPKTLRLTHKYTFYIFTQHSDIMNIAFLRCIHCRMGYWANPYATSFPRCTCSPYRYPLIYECPTCTATTYGWHYMQFHMSICHACQFCHEPFFSNKDLIQHIFPHLFPQKTSPGCKYINLR